MKQISSASFKTISSGALEGYLAIKDLTEPTNGVHAINVVIEKLIAFFQSIKSFPPVEIRRGQRIVNTVDEFDTLYIPSDSPQRLPQSSRYIDATTLLRTHTTPLIVKILKEIKQRNISDGLFFLPGICYRRTTIDKQRVGQPHKMDIWRIKKGRPRLNKDNLVELIEAILKSTGTGTQYRTTQTTHSYTTNGLVVEVPVAPDRWLKLFECGEASEQLLQDAGLDPSEYSGLALGLGLERLVMHIKKIDDIRLLSAENPLIRSQMTNLQPYVSVADYPAVYHDFSVVVPSDYQPEDICEKVIDAITPNKDVLETVTILEEAQIMLPPGDEHSPQKKVLLRTVFRSVERKLDANDINMFVDKIYKAFSGASNS